MPEPVRSGQRYMPGLDGLRALAVLAVIAYHEQLGWAPGGLLGVGVFFTLSGYLITDLLLGQWARSGGLNLGDFWLRRARRLLPALFVMLAVVTAWVTVVSPSRLASLRGAVAAAATYSSNWFYIYTHNSYFARFAPPGPLDHLWSLAVEEQFYLVWPWLLLLGVYLVRGRRPERGPLAGAAHPDPGRRVGGGDAHALPPRLRPDQDLRGLRHPGLRPADRGRAGHGLAQPPHRPDRAVVPGRAGRRGLRRAGRGRPDDLAGGPVLGVHLPGRAGAALGGHGRGGGRGRLPRHPGRRGPGLEAAALDRCPFLRDLPVALPRDHPDFAGQFHREPAPRRPASGREHRDCRAVVAFRRRANPPWRAGTGLETDAFADGLAGAVGRGQQLGRGHRRGHGGRAGLCRAERRGAGARRQQRGHRHPGRGLGPAAGRRRGPGRLGHERVQHERDQHERDRRHGRAAKGGSGAGGSAKGPGSAQATGRARPAARRPRRPRSAPPARR